MRALWSLLEHSFVSREEYESLTKAYVFLRDVENKLQMVHDAQTHSLPLAEDELAACAILLGYRNDGIAGSAVEAFERDYRHHTDNVSRLFEEFLGKADLKRFSRTL
jgi:glutamate-ammonia-ligase adenylyltransferase